MNYATCWLLRLVLLLVLCPVCAGADDSRQPTVGAPGRIEQLFLPGSELVPQPIDDKSPIVLRVLQKFRHGDGFRYDFQFVGLEPGDYDLSQWLVRADDSPTDDLPAIPVTIRSLLPPGQVEPNRLETGWIPRMGGYRRVMMAVALLWLLVLAGLIFAGRKRVDQGPPPEPELTLADLLTARLADAMENRMPREQYAELERMLVAFWRKRLDLDSLPTSQAIQQIRQHPQAGPLLRQLEEWLHSPTPPPDLDLPRLLESCRRISVTDTELNG